MLDSTSIKTNPFLGLTVLHVHTSHYVYFSFGANKHVALRHRAFLLKKHLGRTAAGGTADGAVRGEVLIVHAPSNVVLCAQGATGIQG